MNGNTCQFMEVLLLLRDCHFTWSSEPREGPAVFRAKAAPSFLSYFKTLSIGPAPGIELRPAALQSSAGVTTELILIYYQEDFKIFLAI